MSSLLMGAVFQCGPKDQALAMVMLSIADCADDFGFAFPATATIAAKARCDVRSVYRYLDELEAEGWLRRAHKLINGKGNAYMLDCSKLGVTLSPDARMSPVFAALVKRHGDSLSLFFAPKKSGDQHPASGDNPQPRQVTETGGSGDKKAGSGDARVTLTFNQEPSGFEPSTSVQPDNPPTPLRGEAATRFTQAFRDLKGAMKAELKGGVPGGIADRKFRRIREDQDDYDTCFRNWWGVDTRVLAGEFIVITEATDVSATETGFAKYKRRLEMLARRTFAVNDRMPVRFTVRQLQQQTSAA